MTERQRMQFHLPCDNFLDLLQADEDDDNNLVVVHDKQIGKSRWNIEHLITIQDTSDGRFYQGHYDEPKSYDELGLVDTVAEGMDLTEVFAEQRTITVYV